MRKFELDIFDITHKEANLLQRLIYRMALYILKTTTLKLPSIYTEKSLVYDDCIFKNPPAKYYSGFFQSYKYFDEIAETIRSKFSFRKTLDSQNLRLLQHINQVNSVSIHIRRGDYIYWDALDQSHVLSSLAYYHVAIELLQQKLQDFTFFVFTDDVAWVKAHLKINYVLVEGNTDSNSWKDMYLMSCCKHHIIANSTFSWWAAWLNNFEDKVVIAPKKWFGNELNDETIDLCPQEWIRI